MEDNQPTEAPESQPTEAPETQPTAAPEAPASNTAKDPGEWVTGEEPMTGAQASYLRTLSQEAKEPFDEKLTKAQASKRIDELQSKTGRGT